MIIHLNLKGVRALDPTRMEIPSGPYKVRLVGFEEKEKSVLFSCTIAEGDYDGVGMNVAVGVDTSKKGNLGHWRALLEGIGANAAALEADAGLDLNTESLMGKTGFIYVNTPPAGELDEQGRRPFARTNFISKVMFEQLSKVRPAVTGATATGPMTAARPQTATGAAPNGPATPPPAQAGALNELFG